MKNLQKLLLFVDEVDAKSAEKCIQSFMKPCKCIASDFTCIIPIT